MSKKSSPHFSNLRWQVDSSTRLSISTWADKFGYTTHAVALLRKVGNKWEVVGETASEFRFKDSQESGYRATCHGSALVAQVLGTTPERFFRDAAV